MNSLKMAWRNMLNKPLSMFLSLLLIAVSIASVNVVVEVNDSLQKQVRNNTHDVDMVVGAKGSPLQILLSTLMFIDNPTGNINKEIYLEYKDNPLVKDAAPIAVGDNYKGYKIVGTDKSIANFFDFKIDEGKLVLGKNSLLVGAGVAKKLGISVGDEIHASHGSKEEGKVHNHAHLHVVGILKEQGNIADQLIFTHLKTVWDAHHGIAGADEEITALWLKFRSPLGMVQFPRIINKKDNLMVALPEIEMNRLMKITGSGVSFLKYFAYLLLFISAFSLFLHLMNQVSLRKKDIAIFRQYGIRKSKGIELVLLEALLVSFGGFLLAWALSKLSFNLINDITAEQYKQALTMVPIFSTTELILLLGTILMALLASVWPLVVANKTDVIKILKSN